MTVRLVLITLACFSLGTFQTSNAAQWICETSFSASNAPSQYRPGRAIRALQSIDPQNLVVHTLESAWPKDARRAQNLIATLSSLIRGNVATLLGFEDSLVNTQLGSDSWIEKVRDKLEIDILPQVNLEDYSKYHHLRMTPHYLLSIAAALFGFSLWNLPTSGEVVAHGLYVGGSLMAATTAGTAGFFLSTTFIDVQQTQRMDGPYVDRPSHLAPIHLSQTGQAYFILIHYQTTAGAQHTLVLGYGLQPNTVPLFGSRFKNTEPYFFAIDADFHI